MRDALRAFAAGHPRFLPNKVEVHIGGLGESRVELFVQVYFRVATFTDEMVCRDEFSREVLTQAARLGVELAVPTQKRSTWPAADAESRPVPPEPKHLGLARPESSLHVRGRREGHAPGGEKGE